MSTDKCFFTACNFCFLDAGSGDDVAECNKQQSSQACSSNVFPNLGTTHCYTAAGLYNNGSQVNSTGIARGCINCTGKKLFFFSGTLTTNAVKRIHLFFREAALVS